MSSSRTVIVVLVMILGLVFLLSAPAAQATVYYWTGTDCTWDTSAAANWSLATDGSSPFGWQGSADADFYVNGQSTTYVTVNNPQSVGNITFDGGDLLLTTTVQIGTGGVLDLAGVSQTIAALSDASPGNYGIVTNSGAAATLTLAPPSGSSNTFTGVIQDGNPGGQTSWPWPAPARRSSPATILIRA